MQYIEPRHVGDGPGTWIKQPVEHVMHDKEADLNQGHGHPRCRQRNTYCAALGGPEGGRVPKEDRKRNSSNRIQFTGDALGYEPLPQVTAQHLMTRWDYKRSIEREATEPERDGSDIEELSQRSNMRRQHAIHVGSVPRFIIRGILAMR